MNFITVQPSEHLLVSFMANCANSQYLFKVALYLYNRLIDWTVMQKMPKQMELCCPGQLLSFGIKYQLPTRGSTLWRGQHNLCLKAGVISLVYPPLYQIRHVHMQNCPADNGVSLHWNWSILNVQVQHPMTYCQVTTSLVVALTHEHTNQDAHLTILS